MSDRRAVSAGHLGASSVAAAHEAWRVAVGGNRVESMSIEQIAHAFHAGQLNARTPLWPPGATGWQALGNFPEFQMHPSAFAQQGLAQQGLAQFNEADDDPTRMWTGGNDLASMESAMQAPHARPSAQTGVRQVARSPVAPAPPPVTYAQPGAPNEAYAQQAYAMPAPPPVPSRPVPSRPAPTASVASQQPALVPSSMPPFRSKSRGNGLMLAAGLVGLVGLGSAVLAARGNWGSASAHQNEQVAVSAEATTESERSAPEPAAPAAEASKTGEAQLAKYEDTSAMVAGEADKPAAKEAASEEAKPEATKVESLKEAPKADETEKASAAEKEHDEPKAKSEKVSSKAAAAHARAEEAANKRLAAREKKRAAAAAAAERRKPAPRAAKVEPPAEKPEKAEKVEKAEKAVADAPQAPANAAVNEAAAAALTNSANLASSCRPRGGPAGAGKARVVYSNDGEVQSVEILTAKFRDTLTGSCVRMVFRRAKIAPFKGEPPTFIKSFTIPEE